MKSLATVAVLFLASVAAFAQAKPCEELKAEIAKKIEANGVKSYTLDIVDKDKEADGKVVGSCGGGTKKIVYKKTTEQAEKPAAAEPKKQ